MARAITMATGKVAFTASFPVEVLIKSEPVKSNKAGLYSPSSITAPALLVVFLIMWHCNREGRQNEHVHADESIIVINLVRDFNPVNSFAAQNVSGLSVPVCPSRVPVTHASLGR